VITSRQRPNAVLASPTGTGKTLAYLLPMLTVTERGNNVSGGGSNVRIMIVTPTVELAYQIQTVVDRLWPPPPLSNLARSSLSSSETTGPSSLYVVGTNQDMELTTKEIYSQGPSLVAGTPKAINGLISYCTKMEREEKMEDLLSAGAGGWGYNGRSRGSRGKKKDGIFSNLQIVVLDEADRLLKTEKTARLRLQRSRDRDASLEKRRRPSFPSSSSSVDSSQTHELLNSITRTNPNLTLSLSQQTSFSTATTTLQLICVSATVGRTLRRQIMDITEAPNIDGAATLVCGEGDGRLVVGKKKNKKKKKVGDDEDGEEEDEYDEEEEEIQRRRSLLPGEEWLQHAYALHDDDDESGNLGGMEEDCIRQTIWKTMEKLPPAPCLIFPGKDGVTKVCDFLSSPVGGDDSDGDGGGCGLENIRTLRGKYVAPTTTAEDDNGEELSSSSSSTTTTTTTSYSSWKTTPVYVIGERFARGLDLPDIQYVLISTPPTSGALYAHLAGRTGRKKSGGGGEGGGWGGERP